MNRWEINENPDYKLDFPSDSSRIIDKISDMVEKLVHNIDPVEGEYNEIFNLIFNLFHINKILEEYLELYSIQNIDILPSVPVYNDDGTNDAIEQKLENLAERMLNNSNIIYEEGLLDENYSGNSDDKRTETEKLIFDLQMENLSWRLISIEGLFKNMIRHTRSICGKFGKKVNIETYGEDTKIDKNVIELLLEPVELIIKNIIEIGMETPAERILAGKNETGTITIEALNKDGEFVVIIKDDGLGINKKLIHETAIENGLINRYDKELKDRDLFMLIFESGFSTMCKKNGNRNLIYELNSVKRNMDILNGKIEILSEYGNGTVIELRIPMIHNVIELAGLDKES